MKKKQNKDSEFATKNDLLCVEKSLKFEMREIVTEAFDNFAVIMKRSFDDIHERMLTKDEFYATFEPFKKETEQSLYELQSDTTDLKTRMTRVENRLDGMDTRFDTTDEKLDIVIHLQKNHEKRITKIETKFA